MVATCESLGPGFEAIGEEIGTLAHVYLRLM
jgi:hypothetical protein